jgi:hypothetical protein
VKLFEIKAPDGRILRQEQLTGKDTSPVSHKIGVPPQAIGQAAECDRGSRMICACGKAAKGNKPQMADAGGGA